ncbi:hyaluronidase PH-20 [Neopsephotus bourkii]|uniref:hyaluronidase PH-20 n=1 Tax=Neopsephotus bourkii TaxID=309878 RepID=UPI002AA59EDD|nr:hyaluronidase PH-20 [Neopsephotus bourkii]XP_061228946.1 hyaluronidase PH-20 [Neopsephotus bourkii]
METVKQSFGICVTYTYPIASGMVFATLLVCCCSSLNIRARPLVHNSPFLSIWNAPTELCTERTGVQLDMNFFSFIGSTLKTATGQNITLFYPDRLGYYPYKNEITGEALNGGLPQLSLLENHLKKAKEDIQFYIPSDEQFGLAVIDWENWRPVWIRNWGSKDIYRQESIELVQQRDLSLSEAEARIIAKMEFEAAAKSIMLESLKLGIEMKPNRLWGYYLYPDCYNYDYKQNPHNYTGTCLDIEIERNNELNWLWEKSTALYPSIYLETALRSSRNAQLFVRNRVQEAIRISYVSNATHPLPVFVYTRPVFTDVYEEYLSQDDLVNTIGESAALGASGIVIWGDMNLTQNKNTCRTLDNYLRRTLTPYLINVTMAARICSQVLCQDSGACVRKKWNSSDYLHLNPDNIVIQMTKDGKYTLQGQPAFQDLQTFIEKFDCRCYAGQSCEPRADINDIHYLHVCISQDICIQISSNALFNIEDSEEKILSNRTVFLLPSQIKVTLSTHPETDDFQSTFGNNILNATIAKHSTVTAVTRYDLEANDTRTSSSSSSDKITMFNLLSLILIFRTLIQMIYESENILFSGCV